MNRRSLSRSPNSEGKRSELSGVAALSCRISKPSFSAFAQRQTSKNPWSLQALDDVRSCDCCHVLKTEQVFLSFVFFFFLFF